MRFGLAILSLAGAFLLANSYDSDFYGLVSYFLLIYFFLDFIYSLGRSLRILDIPILFSIFQLLIMPGIVYYQFNDDPYVKALQYNMTQPKEVYYDFMVPAVLAFIAGLKLPLTMQYRNYYSAASFKRITDNIRQSLSGKENTGLLLIGIGFVFGAGARFLPSGLDYFGFLFGKLIYVGILYAYFSDAKPGKKRIYLIGGIILILLQSLSSGLFGEMIYFTVMSTMVILLGQKQQFARNLVLCLLGSFLIVVLQTVKGEYRRVTWNDPGADKVNAFTDIALDRIVHFENNFTTEGMFPIVVRFNQGMLVDKTMDYVPRATPYQEGRTILLSLAASFVPRYLWPDKPIAGGHENMLLFTGYDIEGYSMNVGPYGEAWGNFGKDGGIAYLFFYGLFFNIVFFTILKKAQKHPTLLLWVPYLFINSIQVETDTLMTVNTIIKGALFMWGFFFVFKRVTGLSL